MRASSPPYPVTPAPRSALGIRRWSEARPVLDVDCLDIRKEILGRRANRAGADAGSLDAPKRHVRLDRGAVINMNHSALDAVDEAPSQIKLASENSGSQAILDLVGQRHSFFEAVDRH